MDPALLSAWRSSEVDLVDVLEVPEEALTAWSQQAMAFLEVGKPKKATQVLVGLGALGRVHLVDVLVLARALELEGRTSDAAIAAAHEQRLEQGLGIRVPEGPPLVVLRDYLGQLPSLSAAEIQAEWEGQRRLAGAVTSYLTWVARLSDAPSPLGRVEAALQAIGPSAARSTFPQKALKALIKQVGTRPPAPAAKWARTNELEGRLVARLGEAVTAPITALLRGPHGAAARPWLLALADLTEQAATTPSYCVTRMGWHYPRSLAEYRTGQFHPIVAELSELRWMHSLERIGDGLLRAVAAPRPAESLAALLTELFFAECGHDRRRAPVPEASPKAIARALEHQLLTPLRALNETILDFDLVGLGAPDDVRRMVDDLMRAVTRDDYALYGPYWASKDNDGPDGFDVAGHRLLHRLRDAGALGVRRK